MYHTRLVLDAAGAAEVEAALLWIRRNPCGARGDAAAADVGVSCATSLAQERLGIKGVVGATVGAKRWPASSGVGGRDMRQV